MQFRLGALFMVMLLIAVFCGLLFAAPPAIGTPALVAIQAVCPAIWFSGAFFARGAWRAFFVGGIAAGTVPYIVTLYALAMLTLSEIFVSVSYFGNAARQPSLELWMPAANSRWWMMNLLFLVPGIFSFVGGGLSVGVYRIFNPSPHGERSDDSPFKSA